MPRKRNSPGLRKKDSASPSKPNKKARKSEKPNKPLSARMRTYMFFGFGYRRLDGFNCRAISGTVVSAQSGKVVVHVETAGSQANAQPGMFAIDTHPGPVVSGARACRIRDDEIFQAFGLRVPQAGKVTFLPQE